MSTRAPLVGALVCLVAGLLVVYAPLRTHDFLPVGDDALVTANAHLRESFGPRWLGTALGHAHDGRWMPVTWLSLRIDAALYGTDDATGWLATNLALHVITTIAVAAIAAARGWPWFTILLVAGSFGLHWWRIEQVAWIAARGDLLAACFVASAAWIHARSVRRGLRAIDEAALLVGTLAASLSSPWGVALPLVVLALDPRLRRNDPASSPATRREAWRQSSAPLVLAMLAGAAHLSVGAGHPLERVLPDHRLSFLAWMIVTVGIAALLPRAVRTRGRRAAASLVVVALLVFGAVRTHAELATWRDGTTLLAGVLVARPDHAIAHRLLASILYDQEDDAAAEVHARRAVVLRPVDDHAQTLLAELLARRGADRAAQLVEHHAHGRPRDARDARVRLGLAFARAEFDDEARELLEPEVEHDPESGDLNAALAAAFARDGRIEHARTHRDRALDHAPTTVEGRIVLAWLLATSPSPELRDPELALRVVDDTLEHVDAEPELLDARAAALAERGEYAAAFEQAQRAALLARERGWSDLESAIRRRAMEYLQGRTWRRAGSDADVR